MGRDTSQGTTGPHVAGLLTCAKILTNLQEQRFSALRYVHTSGTPTRTNVGEQLQDTLGAKPQFADIPEHRRTTTALPLRLHFEKLCLPSRTRSIRGGPMACSRPLRSIVVGTNKRITVGVCLRTRLRRTRGCAMRQTSRRKSRSNPINRDPSRIGLAAT